MGSLNRVFLLGNLTRDVELRTIPSGTSVADIGVAVNERRKDASGQVIEDTTFVEVTLWGRTAEIAAEYLKKGSPVLIEGRLKLDTWAAEDGSKRSKLKVVANNLQMMGKAPTGTKSGGDAPAGDEAPPVSSDEPVPF